MEIRVGQLEDFFKSIDLSKYDGIIVETWTVANVAKMVHSHILFLRSNKGNQCFRPYYDRLVKLYNAIKMSS